MQRMGRKRRVLEAIPWDRFVSSGEIAARAGVSPQGVGVTISWNFMPFVEVKEIDDPKPGTKVYKRRLCSEEAEG